MNIQLQKQLLSEKWTPDKLIEKIAEDPSLVQDIVNNLNSSETKLKYRSGKMAIMLSDQYPKKIYKCFDKFVELLDSKNKIITWTGIRILGNLAKVDSKNKVEKILGLLYNQLNTGVMITANNTILALTEIAKAKPDLTDEIVTEILRIEKYKYQTKECHNITKGFVIEALEELFEQLSRKKPAIKFVKKELNNSRRSTKKKAGDFINKIKRSEAL